MNFLNLLLLAIMSLSLYHFVFSESSLYQIDKIERVLHDSRLPMKSKKDTSKSQKSNKGKSLKCPKSSKSDKSKSKSKTGKSSKTFNPKCFETEEPDPEPTPQPNILPTTLPSTRKCICPDTQTETPDSPTEILTLIPTTNFLTESPTKIQLTPTLLPDDNVKPVVRIMPLGDSLTKGQNLYPGGYRKLLFKMLKIKGYNVDFVGTQVTNTAQGIDKHHEGKGGTTIGYQLDNIESFLSRIDYPDIVLLNIGTNDFGKEVDVQNAIYRLDELIQKIASLRPYAHVIVSSLIVRVGMVNDEINRLYNPFIPDVVNKNKAKGVRCSFLDLYPVVKVGQLDDGIHPNQEGYDAMALAWLGAVQKITTPLGDTYPPRIVTSKAILGTNQVMIVISKGISNQSLAKIENFGISHGVKVKNIQLDQDKRTIILTTTSFNKLEDQTVYVVIIKDVVDRTQMKLPITPFSVSPLKFIQPVSTLAPTYGENNPLLPAVRIMPMGSDLTKGQDQFPGSYRKKLYMTLRSQGWNVDFVGTKSTNRAENIDPNHEGIASKMIFFFDRFADFWLDKIDYPDIILLYVGSYDFTVKNDIENAIIRYDRLIQRIASLRPFSHIIATNLITRNEPEDGEIEKFFNPFVEDIVQKNADNNVRVSYLDMRSYVKPENVLANNYLNQDGYNQMADGWIDAIKKVYTPLGDKNKPIVVNAVGDSDKNVIKITFTKPVADSAADKSLYQVNSDIVILNASLSKDKRTVTLKTSNFNETIGGTLSLVVMFVTDRLTPSNQIPKTLVNVDISSRKPTLKPTATPLLPDTKVRIMPFGGELTVGRAEDAPGGYRRKLYWDLRNSGYNVDFIGSKISNKAEGVDPNFEATTDKFIHFYNKFVEFWLNKVVDTPPDVILLHVGAYDFERNYQIKTAINRYDTLIKKIHSLQPHSRIIATNLLKREDDLDALIEEHFNQFVEGIVNDNIANGIPISFLDLRSFITTNQLVDGVHPNQDGYNRMADGWLSAIQKVIGPLGIFGPPVVMRSETLVQQNQIKITFNKPILDKSVLNLKNFSTDKNVNIIDVNIDNEKRVVTLITSNLKKIVDQTLKLTLKNISDRTNNNNGTMPEAVLSLYIFDTTLTPVDNNQVPTISPIEIVNKIPLSVSTTRILPLGGSLTRGQNQYPGGYRKNLYKQLIADGYNVDFLGTKTFNRATNIDPHHEGNEYKLINFFNRFAEFWLDKMEDPDIILLHVGTYDFDVNNDVKNAINRYDSLIKKIASLRPYAHIIATNLLVRNEPENSSIQTHFNPFVKDIVNANAANGIRVSYLDIRSYVEITHLDNGVFPNQDGYDAMANAWFDAIKAVTGPDGDNYAPRIMNMNINISFNQIIITFSKPVANNASNIMSYTIDRGVIVLSAELEPGKRVVTLTTSRFDNLIGESITLTVANDITDRTLAKRNLLRTSRTIAVQTTAPTISPTIEPTGDLSARAWFTEAYEKIYPDTN